LATTAASASVHYAESFFEKEMHGIRLKNRSGAAEGAAALPDFYFNLI
jgi:hypothetical protein